MKAPAEMKGRLWMHSTRAGRAYASGRYEANVQQVLREYLTEGAVFWDVGAHVGFFSLFCLGIVGKSGRVISFEPLIDNFEYLKRLWIINGTLPEWSLHQAAVSDQRKVMNFAEGPTSTTGKLDTEGKTRVQCYRADDVWLAETRRDLTLVKVDVEGAAGGVLAGARQLLESARPRLLVEIHAKEEARGVLSALPSCYDAKELTDWEKGRSVHSQHFLLSAR